MTLEDIRVRIIEIERELFAPSAYLNTAILRKPDPKAQLAHENRRVALTQERQGLLAQLPKTGEASGQHLVLNRTLGTVYVRASELEYAEDPRDAHNDDSMWRHMKECGENWE